jgi:3'-phosphoadenosine 5'-phosphosulfate sulfotransferase (PAPS reductase)/FAD synthetase
MSKKQVCVSGGSDSTALALLLWERGEDFEMAFADTGAELPEVYWLLPRLAQYVGKKLTVVSGGSFFQLLVQYGYMLQVRVFVGVPEH